MPRYKVHIEYDGTNYAGWQTQPNELTIQDAIEAALNQVLRVEIPIVAAGRTDSGVHAEDQVAHFDYKDSIDSDKLLKSLYGVLPRDIAVWRIEQAHDDFHARFDAIARQYRYQIITRPSPLLRNYAWEQFYDLDIETMRDGVDELYGVNDFSSFCRFNPDVNHTMCDVHKADLFTLEDNIILFRIKANRFLHHMVRSLAGTIVEIGLGKRDIQSLKDLLKNPNRDHAGVTAPAHALILEKVFY